MSVAAPLTRRTCERCRRCKCSFKIAAGTTVANGDASAVVVTSGLLSTHHVSVFHHRQAVLNHIDTEAFSEDAHAWFVEVARACAFPVHWWKPTENCFRHLPCADERHLARLHAQKNCIFSATTQTHEIENTCGPYNWLIITVRRIVRAVPERHTAMQRPSLAYRRRAAKPAQPAPSRQPLPDSQSASLLLHPDNHRSRGASKRRTPSAFLRPPQCSAAAVRRPKLFDECAEGSALEVLRTVGAAVGSYSLLHGTAAFLGDRLSSLSRLDRVSSVDHSCQIRRILSQLSGSKRKFIDLSHDLQHRFRIRSSLECTVSLSSALLWYTQPCLYYISEFHGLRLQPIKRTLNPNSVSGGLLTFSSNDEDTNSSCLSRGQPPTRPGVIALNVASQEAFEGR
eukprot:COSAG02_NODE_6897_length_3300_cov_1.506092_1_plen_397_part_00